MCVAVGNTLEDYLLRKSWSNGGKRRLSYILVGEKQQLHGLVDIESKPTRALLDVDLIQTDVISFAGQCSRLVVKSCVWHRGPSRKCEERILAERMDWATQHTT